LPTRRQRVAATADDGDASEVERGVDEVRQIGETCLKYTGKINSAKMPVFVRIMEVGAGSADQQQRLKLFKRSSLRAKVIPSAMIVDTASGDVWNSDRTWVSKGVYHGFVEQLVAAQRERAAESDQLSATAARAKQLTRDFERQMRALAMASERLHNIAAGSN
jgi:hypothetical protein